MRLDTPRAGQVVARSDKIDPCSGGPTVSVRERVDADPLAMNDSSEKRYLFELICCRRPQRSRQIGIQRSEALMECRLERVESRLHGNRRYAPLQFHAEGIHFSSPNLISDEVRKLAVTAIAADILSGRHVASRVECLMPFPRGAQRWKGALTRNRSDVLRKTMRIEDDQLIVSTAINIPGRSSHSPLPGRG